MTLQEIADYAASSVGFADATTVAQAKSFARLRWKMIWDAANWRQGRYEVQGTVAANTEEVVMPTEVETVLAVRLADRELLPSDDLVEIQSDPAGLGTPGDTLAFSPTSRDEDGNARIRLHRPLKTTQTLTIICKRKCPELVNDTDRPLIPGVDQCLVAFTLGDLYRWSRQLTRAQACYQEATTHLEMMKKLEVEQAASVIRIVPWDAGMDFRD